jgi:hypothetical protein
MRIFYILPLSILILLVLLPALKQSIIPPKYQKYFWIGVVIAIVLAIFGFDVVVFIAAFYYLIKPTIDANSNQEDD